jgi:hypothetical protein
VQAWVGQYPVATRHVSVFRDLMYLPSRPRRTHWSRRPDSYTDADAVGVGIQQTLPCPCDLALAHRRYIKFVAGLLIRRRSAAVHWYAARMRPRGDVYAAQNIVLWLDATGPSTGAHTPSPRPNLLTSPPCVSKRAPQDTTSSAKRRADVLLNLGATVSSLFTTLVPTARSQPAAESGGSACQCRGDHRRRAAEAHELQDVAPHGRAR